MLTVFLLSAFLLKDSFQNTETCLPITKFRILDEGKVPVHLRQILIFC